MYFYRNGNEIIAVIGEYFGGKFAYSENIVDKNDEKCFSCKNFDCNHAGDILCKKESGSFEYRDNLIIRKCKNKNWYDKRRLMTGRGEK